MENFIEIYTESTPNPESLKFVTSRFLLKGAVADFKNSDAAKESPLALMLFDIPFVQGVFVSNHFVTVTKKPEYDWFEISPEIKEAIKGHLLSGKEIFTRSFYEALNLSLNEPPAPSADIDTRIIELLDKYVKPAVEMDGGHIAFKSFQDGVVRLSMQGSCSGCPSSTITLKSGIEGLLKRMVPEVQEVVADAE